MSGGGDFLTPISLYGVAGDQNVGSTTTQQTPVQGVASAPLATPTPDLSAGTEVGLTQLGNGESTASDVLAPVSNFDLLSSMGLGSNASGAGGSSTDNLLSAMGLNTSNAANSSSSGTAGSASNFLSNLLSGVTPDQWMKTIGGALSGLEMEQLQSRALNIQQQNANDNSELTQLKAQQQSNQQSASGFNLGILGRNMAAQGRS